MEIVFHIILLHPEIPPNTGNIIRLAANTGAELHLAGRLGFSLEDRHLRRAGLDYHEHARVHCHESLESAYTAAGDGRRFAAAVGGETRYDRPSYQRGDIFVFGSESVGLPPAVLLTFPAERRLGIPMRPDNRSMNLSNAAAVIVMEAWRQMNFAEV